MARAVETAVGVCVGVVLTVALLSVGGCKGRELEQARKEAKEAKTTATKLQLKLNQIVETHDQLKAELEVVRQTRDDLQKQIDGSAQERDDAVALLKRAEEEIQLLRGRAAGQHTAQASLRQQIDDLKAEITEQKALIETLQAQLEAGPEPIPVPEDPNEVVEEDIG